jgi:hypothetical protein
MDFGWASVKLQTESGATCKHTSHHDKKILDFSSPSSISQTAKMIRCDIRRYKISYFNGMVILIKARNKLKKIFSQKKKDKTLSKLEVLDYARKIKVIEREIRFTKSSMLETYGNPDSLIKNGVLTDEDTKKIKSLYRPIKLVPLATA